MPPHSTVKPHSTLYPTELKLTQNAPIAKIVSFLLKVPIAPFDILFELNAFKSNMSSALNSIAVLITV